MSEEIDSIEKVAKGTPVWVKTVVALVVASCLFFTTYETLILKFFPESFVTDVNEATIEQDIKGLKEEVKEELREEYDAKIKKAEASHYVMKQRIQALEQQLDTYNGMFEGIQKQTTFNTSVISITNDAVYELMQERENNCNIPYKETLKGDNWKMFNDYYDSRVIYSLDTRSDCRAFYTPIFRTKIQVE